MDATPQAHARWHAFKGTADNALRTVREAIREGNYRRVIVRNDHGHTLIDVPLTLGLITAAIIPTWAAVGAVVAMAGGFSIIVERPHPPSVH